MTAVDRLLARSIPEPNSGCWIWLGATKGREPGRQYGSLMIGSRVDGSRRTISAHRYAVEVFTGTPVPSGFEVCHRCDTPSCINPDHLWVGTKADNMADRYRKLRNTIGEKSASAKLTWADVRNIRSSHLGYKKLASQYGVDRTSIRDIRKGVTWRAEAAPPVSQLKDTTNADK